MITITAPLLLTHGFFTLAIIALWFSKGTIAVIPRQIQLWMIPFVGALICGLIFKFLQPMALLPIVLLGGACYIFYHSATSTFWKITAGIVVAILMLGLGIHALPGFNNPIVISEILFSSDAIPYTRYINLDKPIGGLFILAFGYQLLRSPSEWKIMLRTIIPIIAVTVIVVSSTSFFWGYTRFDIKFPEIFFLWAWTNLFYTCIAEEVFFRGFIQKQLSTLFAQYKWGSFASLGIAALLFGIAHIGGGNKYVVLATLSGLGYGWAFHQTQRIEASILTHFSLNTIHFLFLTYPALASSV